MCIVYIEKLEREREEERMKKIYRDNENEMKQHKQ